MVIILLPSLPRDHPIPAPLKAMPMADACSHAGSVSICHFKDRMN